mmetsp:Transcript_21194/g.71772  ORF Transcript_21194/g.71772 Transcript_21194/m.71772 type:complete len:234 (+) Transcript_21194:943-1644(+)
MRYSRIHSLPYGLTPYGMPYGRLGSRGPVNPCPGPCKAPRDEPLQRPLWRYLANRPGLFPEPGQAATVPCKGPAPLAGPLAWHGPWLSHGPSPREMIQTVASNGPSNGPSCGLNRALKHDALPSYSSGRPARPCWSLALEARPQRGLWVLSCWRGSGELLASPSQGSKVRALTLLRAVGGPAPAVCKGSLVLPLEMALPRLVEERRLWVEQRLASGDMPGRGPCEAPRRSRRT